MRGRARSADRSLDARIGTCHSATVPDNVDYDAFYRLLDRPGQWTDAERRTVEFTLREQRELLDGCHSKDRRRRESLAAIVERIETAMAGHA